MGVLELPSSTIDSLAKELLYELIGIYCSFLTVTD